MEQKSDETASGRRRGRPREYDSDQALNRAADLFWRNGYAAVSLDDIARATGMNRPSLAAAFGDKRNLYCETLERYRDASRAQAVELLSISKSCAPSCGASTPRRSIFILRASMSCVGVAIQSERRRRRRRPIRRRQIPLRQHSWNRRVSSGPVSLCDESAGSCPQMCANPMGRARVGTATLHTLAICARAGASRGDLRDIANAAVELLCT